MPTDPWDNPTKVYPVGIHSSRVHKPNDVYPVYVKGEIEVPGREPVELDPDGGPDLPFAREYPAYLNEHLIAVHGDMLFYEDEPHWRLNPTVIRS